MSDANRMYIAGNGDTKFQYLHPDDAVNAFISAYKNKITGNKVYNLGSDNVLTQMEQIVHLKDKARLDFTVKHLSPGYTRFLSFILRPFNIHYLTKEHLLMLLGNILMDCQVAKIDLGWQPSKSNTEIILETIEWYKKEKL
jgi:nucleoside-diphosphate-sugar epimerase